MTDAIPYHLCILLSVLVLAVGFFSVQAYGWVAVAVLIAAMCWYGHFRAVSIVENTGFLVYFLAAGNGMMLGASVGLSVVGLVLAFSAWEMGQLHQRIRAAEQVVHKRRMIRRHRLQLGLVAAITVVLTAAVRLVGDIELGFVWTAVFVILAFVCAGAIGKMSADQDESPK